MKKIISYLCAISVMLTSVAAFADVDDVPTRNWGSKNGTVSYEMQDSFRGVYSLLRYLGIATAEESEFNIEGEATRAEAADMFARFGGKTPAKAQDSPYPDVKVSDKYADGVAAAKAQGITPAGSDKFYPYGTVTADDAAEWAIKALGYDKIYRGLSALEIASRLGILKGVKNSELSRGDLCIVMINTLESAYVTMSDFTADGGYGFNESDTENYLKHCYNIELVKGVLTGIGSVSLYSQDEVPQGYAEIDRVRYGGGENVSDKFFGKNIYAYINEDKEIVAAWENERCNESVTVAKDDVFSLSDSLLEYDRGDGRTGKFKIDPSAILVSNGVLMGAFSYYKDIEYTSLTLTDNTRDGLADVIVAESYKYYITESYSDFSKQIKLGYCDDVIDLSEDVCDGYEMSMGGKAMTPAELKKEYVLSVGEAVKSNGKRHYIIKVSKDIVYGTLSGIEHDGEDVFYTVSGERLELSRFYKGFLENDTEQQKPTTGDVANFYVSHDGKIVFSKINNGYSFGYLMNIASNEDTENDVRVKLYLFEGKAKTYQLAEKVTLLTPDDMKGTKFLSDKVCEAFRSDAGAEKQPVAFKLNSEEKISAIAKEYDMTGKEPGSVDYPLVKNVTMGGDESRFYTGVVSGWYLPWTMNVMEIPDDASKLGDENSYRIFTPSSWGNDYYFASNYITLYNADKFKTAEFVITSGKGGTELDRKLHAYMVKGVKYIADEDDMPAVLLSYFDERGAKKEVVINDETKLSVPTKGEFFGVHGGVKDLRCGDIFQMKKDGNNAAVIRIIAKADNLGTYRTQSQTDTEVENAGTNNPFRQLGIVFGEVRDFDSKAIKVNVSPTGDENLTFIVHLDHENWYQTKATYVLFDTKKGKVEAVSAAELAKGDKVIIRKHFNLGLNVFIIR